MFRVMAVFMRRMCLTPVSRGQLLVVLVCIGLGSLVFGYAVARANGALGLHKTENANDLFDGAVWCWASAFWITVLTKGVSTHREMKADGLL